MASGAQAVVTLNLEHCPVGACEPFAIEALHPDVFLLDLYGRDDQAVYAALQRQAAALSRPPMTLDELLDRLGPTVPAFARAMRAHNA